MSLIKNKLRILFLFIGVLTFINSSSVIAKSTNTFNDTIQYFKDKRISNSLEKIRLIEEIEFLIKKSVFIPSKSRCFSFCSSSKKNTFIIPTCTLSCAEEFNTKNL